MRSYLRAAALILVAAGVAVVADPVHRATTLRVALLSAPSDASGRRLAALKLELRPNWSIPRRYNRPASS